MVTLHEMPLQDIEYYIYLSFAEDTELLEMYHHKEATTEECIDKLMMQIWMMRETYDVVCYGVFLDEEPIGFSVLGPKFLFSFGIDIHFRTKDILIEWFSRIKGKLENEFVTWLYNENERAILFFEKNGMDIVDENDSYKTLAYIN